MIKETRLTSLTGFDIRAADGSAQDGGKMIIDGYAVVFDRETLIGGDTRSGFYEVIDRRAFDGCQMKDVPLKYNHSDSVPILARTRNKSLTLSVDERGLKVHAELLPTQDSKDFYTRIKAGLIDKMSFAFAVDDKGEQISSRGGIMFRRVTKIKRLFDVSIVDIPAYDDTSIKARSVLNAAKDRTRRAALTAAVMRWTIAR